jgi:phosphate transport system substrate-binding protein
VKKILLSVIACALGAAAFGEELRGTFTLSGAWAVYPTAVAWGEAFHKLHPGVTVDVSAGGAGKGASDAIAGLVDIGMVSREPDPAEVRKGIVPVYVLHDAVFPVVSDKHPALDALLRRGLPMQTLRGIYVAGDITAWDAALGTKTGRPIHVYTRSDSCGAAAAWAAAFGRKQEDLKGVGVYGDPGLLLAVLRDPIGLGYNNFSYVFTRDGNPVPGIRLVPVDANGNGKADPEEIVADRRAAVAAIEAGKYPVTRKNYFFVKGRPSGLVREFLKFALSDEGTKVVEAVGTSLPVPLAEREKILGELK